MTGYELLLLVLVAMYLSECIAWVPGEGVAFRARPGRPWGPAIELLGVMGGRWRAIGAGWMPGTGGVAVAEAEPPALSPEGICACGEGAARAGGPLRYEDLGPLEADGTVVKAGPRVIARAATPQYARHLRDLIARLQAAKIEARAALIRAEHDRLLRTRDARRQAARHRVCARALARTTRVLAATLLLALPLGVIVGGVRVGAPILAAALALSVAAACGYRALLRRAGSRGAVPERLLTMILMPPAAIRADDFLTRDLFGGFHALPLARAACQRSAARELAAGSLRRLRHPVEPERAACCEAGAWVSAQWKGRLERWIESEYGPAAELLRPPEPAARSCVVYCPRCLQQYVAARDACSDCPGIRLEALSPALAGS